MTLKRWGVIAMTVASASLSTSMRAQDQPRLHISSRWKQCSIQLDPSLTQSAWRQFTREAGQVVYFRPLADAQPMGAGKFELSLVQYQTNVDDKASAWNDTFVHPDSTHWLYEGSGLQFPGLAGRVGVTSRTDLGLYFTKNFQANYGAYGLQLQQNLIRGAGHWDVSARGSFVSLFGPEDVSLNVYGVDVVANWKHWSLGRVSISPYAGVATYLAASHEKTVRVNLTDEHALSAMGTLGSAIEFSAVRLSAEASISRVSSIALKLGIAH